VELGRLWADQSGRLLKFGQEISTSIKLDDLSTLAGHVPTLISNRRSLISMWLTSSNNLKTKSTVGIYYGFASPFSNIIETK
jgi:hypothetical protein